MLTEYIQKTMGLAHYEIIEDEGTYWGEISGFQGYGGNQQLLKNAERHSEKPWKNGLSSD